MRSRVATSPSLKLSVEVAAAAELPREEPPMELPPMELPLMEEPLIALPVPPDIELMALPVEEPGVISRSIRLSRVTCCSRGRPMVTVISWPSKVMSAPVVVPDRA